MLLTVNITGEGVNPCLLPVRKRLSNTRAILGVGVGIVKCAQLVEVKKRKPLCRDFFRK
jgi:hypothetical protein